MSTKKKNVGKKPMRLCVCCSAEKPKGEMLRILISGRNTEVDDHEIDMTGKKHGRGAYICKNSSCIEAAYEQGLISEEVKEESLKEAGRFKLQLISLAMKAGMLAAGEFSAEEAIKSGVASFVIIAEDASDNTKKKFEDKCNYRGIEYEIYGKKEEIGQLIGKSERSVVAIKGEQFGAQLKRRFGGNE